MNATAANAFLRNALPRDEDALPRDEDAVPRDEDALSRIFVERSRALVPLLLAREEETTLGRRIASDSIAEMKAAGLFRVARAERFGGHDLDFDVSLRIAEELAQGCGSTSWVFGVLILHDWFMKLWPAEIQQELWGNDPDVLVSSSLQPRPARRVEGGYLLNGDWPFSSGCDHSRWAMVGAIIEGMAPRLLLVPMASVTIVDDWRTLGLRGTGSKTLRFADVFVPDAFAIEHGRIGRINGIDRPKPTGSAWYDTPVVASGEAFAATMLGLARRALDLVALTLRTKVSRGVRLADVELHQLRIGEAASIIDQARFTLLEGSRALGRRLRADENVTQRECDARSRDIAVLVRRLRDTVDTLSHSQTSWIYDSDPFQLIHRDAFTGATHFSGRWENFVLPNGKKLITGETQ